MDNYENQIPGVENAPENQSPATEMPQEPVVAQKYIPVTEEEPEASTAYHDQGTGRKESPFADSPYVMNRPKTEYTPGYTMSPEMPENEKKKGGIWKKLVAAVLVVALVVSACALTAGMVNGYWEERVDLLEEQMERQMQDLQNRIDRAENNGTSNSGTATTDGLTPGQVYAMNERSVVLVYAETRSYGQSGYSTGSGFVLSADGYIVTNAHVVEGGTSFLVVTSDNVQHEATLVGKDTDNDLAVLKIEADNLDPVTLGSSDALIVGDQVAAIGNPLGELTSTLTVGYVSAKERYVTTESSNSINMMQTDCAINSGNSGGPLFNMKGEVVGITTAKYSGTSSGGASIEGIGFAIPIDDVLGLIEDLVEFGYVRSAYLGVQVTTQEEPNGVYVDSVVAGLSADNAGIKAGDIILSVGEYETPTMVKLTRAVRNYNPGDTVEVVIRRGNQELTLTLTFGEKPNGETEGESGEQVPLPEEGDYDEWYEYFEWFFENQERP